MHGKSTPTEIRGSDKPDFYYAGTRTDILPMLPGPVERILEIGCGEGGTSAFLKANGYCQWTCGVELFPDAAAKARVRMDQLIEGNIETLDLPLDKESIDVVLCLDVFEHLVDPWTTLAHLKSFLKPGGTLIASIPNVRCVSVLAPLIFRGQWEYQKFGILDRTHLRFFTQSSAIELMQSSGLKVEKTQPLFMKFGRRLNSLTFSLMTGFLTSQYLISAVCEPE